MVAEVRTTVLEYYAGHGPLTDPGGQAALFAGLPADIPALCRVLQGLLIHTFELELRGVERRQEREGEVEIRPVAEMLARIRELDGAPLTIPRPPERRLIINCRHFALLLCAMLREAGVPARARCGFSTYFGPDMACDHWVCEYWRADERRWVLVDANLDESHVAQLGITFDRHDVPRDRFLLAGRAWELCRAGRADPERFGIHDLRGMWFIRGNVVRDLAALNRTELLPWDRWGLIETPYDDLSGEELALLDRVAALTLAGDEAFAEVRALYERDARLRAPAALWG
ncbi:MAG: transglutaminase-like domain-containing protein [Chloroflexota bacterium]|nr:transglutaminase-like domain-containing protein [Chloroflexota bacterium]